MPRSPFAASLAALAVASLGSGAAAQSVDGAALQIEWCDANSPVQRWVLGAADGTVRLRGNASACVTSVPFGSAGQRTLTVAPCGGAGGAPQSYTYSGNTLVDAQQFAWNDQWGSAVQGAGGFTRLWTAAELSFNSYFAYDAATGLISANFTSAGNSTPSGLCVTAVPPPPPVPPPVPTAAQAAWQQGGEVGCFVHYNMATMAGSQGCGGGAPPPLSAWQPTALDTDAWVDACVAMGGVRIVYVAKHGCGFTAWRSNVSLYGYAYGVQASQYPDVDVAARVVASAKKRGIGYGFYYSVVSNAYANVNNGQVQPGAGPGQLALTQPQYEEIIIAHLTELYTSFGPLAEVWFDGGYQQDLKANLTALFAQLQPDVVAFQGEGLVASPVRWVGSESGLAPYPCWSTCSYDSYGAGDPDAPTWFAAETDFTLQNGDQWFYSPSAGVHSAAELRTMYETSVGHNTALIVDIAPYPNGTVPAAQAAAAAALGAFVSACYSSPIVQGSGDGQLVMSLMPSMAVPIDRIVVQEDIRKGQLVRAFEVTALLPGGGQQVLASGTSIGHKFIAVLAAPVTVSQITLNITAIAQLAQPGSPFISNFAVFSCSSLAEEADAAWARSGF